MDAARRLDARRREHAVLLDRFEQQCSEPLAPMSSRVGARAAIAHRHPWFTQRLTEALLAARIDVVSVVDSGADALAVCIAEQPALLVVDELLVMRPAVELIGEVRALCPHTIVVGYVAGEADIAGLLAAGASAVYTRQVPPADVAAGCADLVGTRTA